MSTVAPIVKRPAPTPSTQSSESSSNPPRKKAKLDLLEPVNPAQKSIAETLPKKRVKVAGSIRRLANSKPFNVKVQAKATLNGSKIGGKSKDLKVDLPNDLKELAKGEIEQLFISSKAEGMNFGGWLKQGATAFTNRGVKVVIVYAMGAAISLALSIALAIQEAVPGGIGGIELETITGTEIMKDEITPDDEEQDLVYQSRMKSTVKIILSCNSAIHIALNPVRVSSNNRGNRSDRGSKRSGRGVRGGR